MIVNPSNALSLLRAPLALLFLSPSTPLRTLSIILAMVTDCFDGYLARRYQFTSRFGTVFDPLMDKFFVYFTLSLLFIEHKIALWQIFAMITRDFFLCLFAIYLLATSRWKGYQFHSVRWGKITTTEQFLVLIALVYQMPIPNSIFYLFILFGAFAFFELLLYLKRRQTIGY